MDIESYRRRKVRYLVESLGIVYCSTWKTFARKLGVKVIEELNLVDEHAWKRHYDKFVNQKHMS